MYVTWFLAMAIVGDTRGSVYYQQKEAVKPTIMSKSWDMHFVYILHMSDLI